MKARTVIGIEVDAVKARFLFQAGERKTRVASKEKSIKFFGYLAESNKSENFADTSSRSSENGTEDGHHIELNVMMVRTGRHAEASGHEQGDEVADLAHVIGV